MQDFRRYIDKLKSSGLRPTKQRLLISRFLFGSNETFHFTVEKLSKMIEKNSKKKISLATIYNTIHVFKKNGYLKEIAIDGNKTYFDTNTSSHHHFYDEDAEKLIDIKNSKIFVKDIPNSPSGKKIKGVEVLVRIAGDNQNQLKFNKNNKNNKKK